MQNVSEAAAYTLQFINQTQKSIFLTGKAGTGKTTLLREIIATTHKNTVVVAPTGIAALNAGGVTIHSMFQLPFSAFIPSYEASAQFTDTVKFENKESLRRHFKMNNVKRNVIKNMELLVIDEVSMMRADLLDAVDFMMQTVRRNTHPFGGVQVLFIGDLLQLPPVIRDEEWRTLKNYYRGKFFFHSHVLQTYPPIYIELSKIYRQTDDAFISVLNNLRNNQITPEDIAILNQYVKPDFDFKENKGYITLTTHNAKADSINNQSINDLDGKEYIYTPFVVGDFPEKIFPVEEELKLKVGAQIMFVKNDLSFEKRYFNGKMGVIKSLSDEEIFVHFPEENMTLEVEKYEWKNIRYKVNEQTKDIEEEVLGTFAHYPIKLAWAITVHKSQGLTFDKAALDVSQVFLPGQAYVALSRLRSLNGLILLSPMQMNGISNDQDVMDYALNRATEEVLKSSLHFETKNFIHNYLINSFNWGELAQEWRNHRFSYNENAAGSEKSKHAAWAHKRMEIIEQLLDPSQKFIAQLNKIFIKETVDLFFVKERVEAAYDYFFKPMDKLVDDLIYKINEIQKFKKVKEFYEELNFLEDLQTKAVLRLMKAKLLIEVVVSGEAISKEKLSSPVIRNYKINKAERIREELKTVNTDIFRTEEPVVRYKSAKADKSELKTAKKTTVEETYDLWIDKNSIEDIARMRKLNVQTIEGHLIRLIQAKKIEITDVLPYDKILALREAFQFYQEESLSGLKEKHGDEFTWDELKMFKASIN
ncbi:helix-turn-helix domain-containing protein [Flavobacterium quisquiliarum]|uniref:Helix-turn-helix domain-containing protein n=1 Tax=Flavobacterium quisquiliarum TaxID=1834436 RepID=A0ABV8WFG2_9FLAO|nr:helix-turn-helix domain-containing protein [Flavobacterium quisquiliarum]MBW1657400.1 AAA family ATPase [Flavobacterium quisquiliarum]NWL01027.1 helicase [Flavobacterium collinsii]